MKSIRFLSLVVFFGSLIASETPTTYRTTITSTLLETVFDGPTLPKEWKGKGGTCTLIDGTVELRQPEGEGHGMGYGYNHNGNFPGVLVLKADVRVGDAEAVHINFNGKGHICRISVTPDGFSAQAPKEKVKGATDNRPGFGLGDMKQAFGKDGWCHITIEIAGDEMLVYTDDKHVLFGKHLMIGREKSSINFIMNGSGARLDNIKVYEATANVDWDKHKERLNVK